MISPEQEAPDFSAGIPPGDPMWFVAPWNALHIEFSSQPRDVAEQRREITARVVECIERLVAAGRDQGRIARRLSVPPFIVAAVAEDMRRNPPLRPQTSGRTRPSTGGMRGSTRRKVAANEGETKYDQPMRCLACGRKYWVLRWGVCRECLNSELA